MRETISGRRPISRQSSPDERLIYTATPSAGRTGGVLICLIKSSSFSHCISTLLLDSANNICYITTITTKTIIILREEATIMNINKFTQKSLEAVQNTEKLAL